jgi:cellulose binding protein with CBM2 domain/fibronectin type III domain protein
MKMKRIPLPRRRPGTALALTALCLGALSLTPSTALADSPLPAPAGLQAEHVSDTSADLIWSSSGLSAGDVVQDLVHGSWQRYPTADPVFGFLHLTGLTRGTTYTFRVYSVPVAGLGYTTSPPSAPVTFTTLSAPDSVPPTQPPAPVASGTTTTMTTLSWGSSTDNVQVTGYDLQELENGAWTTIGTLVPGDQVQEVTGLTPATSYQFAVVAFDAAGNRSARSAPTTVTTLASTPFASCQFQLESYPPGFTAYVTIINNTAAPLSNWTVSFTMPSNTSVATVFGGTLTRTATGGTLTAASYNGTIGSGGETFVGFEGSVSPFNPPSGFTLNGQPCTSS